MHAFALRLVDTKLAIASTLFLYIVLKFGIYFFKELYASLLGMDTVTCINEREYLGCPLLQ